MDVDQIRRLEPKLAKYIDLFHNCFDRKDTRALGRVRPRSAFGPPGKERGADCTRRRRGDPGLHRQGRAHGRAALPAPEELPQTISSPTHPSTPRRCTASSWATWSVSHAMHGPRTVTPIGDTLPLLAPLAPGHVGQPRYGVRISTIVACRAAACRACLPARGALKRSSFSYSTTTPHFPSVPGQLIE